MRSVETSRQDIKVGTQNTKWWLLGHVEATRRAQRRQMYGAEGTNPAWERVDNGSDFIAARMVIKSYGRDLFAARKEINT